MLKYIPCTWSSWLSDTRNWSGLIPDQSVLVLLFSLRSSFCSPVLLLARGLVLAFLCFAEILSQLLLVTPCMTASSLILTALFSVVRPFPRAVGIVTAVPGDAPSSRSSAARTLLSPWLHPMRCLWRPLLPLPRLCPRGGLCGAFAYAVLGAQKAVGVKNKLLKRPGATLVPGAIGYSPKMIPKINRK